MLDDVRVTLKTYTAKPALLGIEIAFLIFPRGNITPKESKEKIKDPQVLYTEVPLFHKIMWGFFTVIEYFIGNIFLCNFFITKIKQLEIQLKCNNFN